MIFQTTKAVEQRLAANWTRTPIQFDGDQSFLKPTDKAWVRPTVIPVMTEAMNVGATVDGTEGLIALDIFYPKGRPGGVGVPKQLAEALAPLYRCVTFSGIQCRIPRIEVMTLPESDPHYGVKVVAPYRRVDFQGVDADMAAYLNKTQTQAAHGFAKGDAIRLSGSTWVGAIADAEGNLALAIVSAVRDVNRFDAVYVSSGAEIEIPSHGKGSAGQTGYLSQVTAKATMTSKPVGGWIQPVFVVKGTDHLIMATPRAVLE